MNQELEKRETNIANLNQQVKTLVDEKAALSEEFAKSNTEISTLKEKLETAEHKITNDEFANLGEIGTLKTKLKDEEDKITGLKKDITGLNKELNRRLTQMSTYNRTCKEKDVKIASLTKDLAKERTEIITLKRDINTLNTEQTRLTDELEKAQSEITKLTQEAKTLADQKSNELENAKIEINKLNKEVKTLADQKSELQRAAGGTTNQQKKVSDLEDMNKTLDQEVKKWRNALHKEINKQRPKDDFTEKLEADLKAAKDLLEAQKTRYQNATNEVYEKRAAINHANEEVKKLTDKVTELEKTKSTQTGQIRGEVAKQNKLTAEMEAMKTAYEKDTAAMTQKVATLTWRIQSQPGTKMNDLKAQLAEEREANAEKDTECMMLRDEITGLQGQMNKLQKKVDLQQKKLRKLYGHIDQTGTDELEAAKDDEEQAGEAGKQGATAEEKVEPAAEKAEATEENAEKAEEKVETVEKKITPALEKEIEQEKAANDVPTAENPAVAAKHEPTVTTSEQPALSSAEVEVKTPSENPIAAKHVTTAEDRAVIEKHEPAVTTLDNQKSLSAEVEVKTSDGNPVAAKHVSTAEDRAVIEEHELAVNTIDNSKSPSAEVEVKTSDGNQDGEQEAAKDVPTAEYVAIAEKHEPTVAVTQNSKLPSTEAKVKAPQGYKDNEQEGPRDVPNTGQVDVADNHETAVTVTEEPKLSTTEVEAEGQGFKAGLFQLTKAEIYELTRTTRQSGKTSRTTEAATVMDANAPEQAKDPHKQVSQAGDPFTEADVSHNATTQTYDPDYDVSDSSVSSDKPVSLDNQTPRALRRPLGQEGIRSRRHSTATDLSVAKVEDWIHRTSTYVEKETQTESMVLMEDMGVQTDVVPMKLPIGMKRGMKKGSEPQIKGEKPNFRQSRGYLLFQALIHLFLILLFLGMFSLAWWSYAKTSAERNLWANANSAVLHGRKLYENGSYGISAIDPQFYRKK